MKLYLDDIHNPATEGIDVARSYKEFWHIVRSYKEFVQFILNNGVPDMISFDHDLGDNVPTGMDCAKWLVDNQYKIVEFNVHSANPVDKNNIESLLNNWKKFCDTNKANYEQKKEDNKNNVQLDISNLFDNNFDSVMHYSVEEHLVLIENIKNNKILCNPLNDTQNNNFVRYFISVPDAVTLYLFDNLAAHHPAYENLKHIWAFAVDGNTVGKRLRDILTDEQRRQTAANILRNLGLQKN